VAASAAAFFLPERALLVHKPVFFAHQGFHWRRIRRTEIRVRFLEVSMYRFLRIPSSLCAAALLAACAHTPAKQSAADSAPAPTRTAASNAASATQPAQQRQASVDFRLAQTKAAKDFVEVHVQNRSLWVLPQPVLTRADLSGVGPIKTAQGQMFVRFSFNAVGAQRLAAVSRQNTGKLLVISIGGDLAALPQIGGPMTEGVLNIPVPNEQIALNITNAIVNGSPQAVK
jgi:preprotein translocase subunit SecD